MILMAMLIAVSAGVAMECFTSGNGTDVSAIEMANSK